MRFLAVFAAVLLFAGIGRGMAGTVDVLQGGSVVEGKSIGEWTAGWWNWANSFPAASNPFTDTTGAVAALHQSGPVFYVAGTPAGRAGPPVERFFQVPANKYILLPLLNTVVANGPDAPFTSTKEEASAFASTAVDPAKLFAEIDGQAVTDLASHREASPINFTLNGGADSLFPGVFHDANSDGYWLMLKPLGKGSHTLHFGGTSDDFLAPTGDLLLPSYSVAITDHATVVPLPGAFWPALLTISGGFVGIALHRRARASAA